MQLKKVLNLLMSILLFSVLALSGCEPAIKKYEYPKELKDILVSNSFMSLEHWALTPDGVSPNHIVFKEQKEAMSFELEGRLGKNEDGSYIENTVAYPGDDLIVQDYGLGNVYFIRIIVKKGDKIAGFAFIEILYNSRLDNYAAHIVSSDLFTKRQSKNMTMTKVNRIMEDLYYQAISEYLRMSDIALQEKALYIQWKWRSQYYK